MNIVDSSGWLEFFADSGNAGFFAPAILDTSRLVVPTLSLYEVFRKILRERGEGEALSKIALMMQGTVAELTSALAVHAAGLSVRHKLPMADSIMLATAQAYGATLWTQDVDFANLPGVRYIRKA